jgi:sugar lactone lactonase YvrE
MPEAGVDLDIERFELDLPSATGAFTYRFRKTGSTEVGTLDKVARDANGMLWYSYGDPLGYYAGTSEVRDASGTLVVRKTRELDNGAVTRSYDLGDNLVMRLLRGAGNVFRGPLRAADAEVATVALGIYGDGTTIFDLAYVDAPSQPRRVGWGVPPTTAPSPTPRPAWRVETVAGGAEGMADGSGAAARFKRLRMLAASRVVPGRYFACDLGNQRIVRLDQGAGGWSCTTLAGNGTAGDADGTGPDARFRSPLGLVVATDDTLYVSEVEGHRIRRIRQPNTAPVVDTIAGTPNPSRVDGAGATARFNGPSGLVLVGERLYVADQGNHALRAIDLASPAFTVTTLVGDGTPGDADGPATTARLRQPVALAQAADGTFWFAESSAGRVRRYDAVSGQVDTVVAGVPEAAGWLDGPPGDCGLFRPVGLFPDGARGTFVTHVDIRAIGADRHVRTIAGQAAQQGTSDGPHDVASFTAVWGVARMGDGSFLLTDSSRIRRLVPPAP